MTELEKLKKMLVDAHDQMRTRKQKNTPTFGAMMFFLGAIVQCNAALNERKKDGQSKIQS
jgi:UDP-N-acetylmuramyl pentapeptide phosphotransferase/UDP-N-acetylglucosamine-1-phosphate transferase